MLIQEHCLVEEIKNRPASLYGAGRLLFWMIFLFYNDFGHVLALTADEDAVFGIVDADALEVEVFNRSVCVLNGDIFDTGCPILDFGNNALYACTVIGIECESLLSPLIGIIFFTFLCAFLGPCFKLTGCKFIGIVGTFLRYSLGFKVIE